MPKQLAGNEMWKILQLVQAQVSTGCSLYIRSSVASFLMLSGEKANWSKENIPKQPLLAHKQERNQDGDRYYQYCLQQNTKNPNKRHVYKTFSFAYTRGKKVFLTKSDSTLVAAQVWEVVGFTA